MAAQIEAGAADDAVDLAPQIRNAARRAGIGGRREQAAKTTLADELAGAVETFDPDIIEIAPPVDARTHRRLGHDQEPWLLQECANFGRDMERLVPAAQQPQVARAQQAEP